MNIDYLKIEFFKCEDIDIIDNILNKVIKKLKCPHDFTVLPKSIGDRGIGGYLKGNMRRTDYHGNILYNR